MTRTPLPTGHTPRGQRPPAAWAARLLLVMLLLSGCSSLWPPAGTPPALFVLQPLPAAAPVEPSKVPRQGRPPMASAAAPVLVLQLPSAAAGFDSAHIVYTQQANRLQTFARHEWVDTPARMLAPLMVATLEASGTFRAVVLAPSSAVGGWQLSTQVLRLQQEFGALPSRVRLRLRAQLIHTASRQVLGTRDFEHVALSSSEDAPGGVAAAQVAAHAVLAELAAWCQSQVLAQP